MSTVTKHEHIIFWIFKIWTYKLDLAWNFPSRGPRLEAGVKASWLVETGLCYGQVCVFDKKKNRECVREIDCRYAVYRNKFEYLSDLCVYVKKLMRISSRIQIYLYKLPNDSRFTARTLCVSIKHTKLSNTRFHFQLFDSLSRNYCALVFSTCSCFKTLTFR